MTSDILLLAWRRPHTTRQVIGAIRPMQPKRLYVACDGPIPGKPEEQWKVEATRDVIEREIDWPCELIRLYSDTNQGCRAAVSRGISWFFDQVEEGIILEDDCIPHVDFFSYCHTLLEYYRHDERVWSISGNNFQDGLWRGDGSYYFSHYSHCWGWASWRRCWNFYDNQLKDLEQLLQSDQLNGIFRDFEERSYWSHIWHRLKSEQQPDSWSYRWIYACMVNGGLTALPNVNLVQNVGHGVDATHMTSRVSSQAIAQPLPSLIHPTFVLRDINADQYFVHNHLVHTDAMASMPTQIKTFARRLLRKVSFSDLSGPSNMPNRAELKALPKSLLTASSKQQLLLEPRHKPGAVQANGGLLNYSDACTLVVGEKEIFEDLVYNFSPSSVSPCIVDCGANIGLASLWFAKRFPTATIHSYEADPDIFSILAENVASFGLAANIHPHNKAIWVDSGGVEFAQEGGFSGQILEHEHELIAKRVLVPSVTLEDVISAFEDIDLLKIDIEGAECQVFTHTLDLSNVQRVFLEFHSHIENPQVLDQILLVLKNQGFRYHIREANPAPQPFIHVEPMLGFDLQLNIYAYRL